MAKTFALGMNAKIYEGPEGTETASLVEMGNVKDVTLTLDADEADVTTRENGGWKGIAATLRGCSAEFEMLWKPGDPCFQEMKTAYLTSGLVRLAVLTGPRDEEDSEGPVGDFTVTNFTRGEPIGDAVKVSVSVKLAVFDEWLVVEAPA